MDIQKKHLKVVHKDKDGGWTTVVDDDLTWEVHKDECIWSLIPGEHVHVSDSGCGTVSWMNMAK